MCVIIVNQKANKVSKSILKSSALINPHMGSVLYLDNYKVERMSSQKLARVLYKTERPYIAHFRYATRGGVSIENTHPFAINEHAGLFHNGTIEGMGSATKVDTQEMAEFLSRIPRSRYRAVLEKHDSRFVTYNTELKSFRIYNRFEWHEWNGVLFSKSNVLPRTHEKHELVAVYGTLKQGCHNNCFLWKSELIAKGETVNPYIMTQSTEGKGSGIPYVHPLTISTGKNIDVEVYKVPHGVDMDELDRLEGHPRFYKREKTAIKLDNGRVLDAWVYFCDRIPQSGSGRYQSFGDDAVGVVHPKLIKKLEGYKQPKRKPLVKSTAIQSLDQWYKSNRAEIAAAELVCSECHSTLEACDEHHVSCTWCGAEYNETEFDTLVSKYNK